MISGQNRLIAHPYTNDYYYYYSLKTYNTHLHLHGELFYYVIFLTRRLGLAPT